MKAPFVTVGICSYNRAHEIINCLESVCKQSYQNFDIVIVDDGSTDNTADVVRDYLSNISDINRKIVTHKQNKGLYAARNTCVREASGEIVAFLDTDSIADKHWLTYLVEGFGNSNVAMVGGTVEDYYDGSYIQLATMGMYAHQHYRKTFGPVRYILGGNMAGRRSFLLNSPIDESESYGNDDREWCEKVHMAGFIVWYVPEARVIHKHRQTLVSLIRQQYLLGLSSPRFRMKFGRFPLNIRSSIFLLVLMSLFLSSVDIYFYIASMLTAFVFIVIVLVREIKVKVKRVHEIFWTYPVTLLASIAMSAGVIVGIAKHSITLLFRSTR